jgi:hypothetical protein
MNARETIEDQYPGRLTEPLSADRIPRGVYMVYILVCDGRPIVVGHGKHNRARVIFDDAEHTTSGHIKAIFVRAYHLFGGKRFERYFIECDSKSEAKVIEKDLHGKIGGDSRELPDEVGNRLFDGFDAKSVPEMILRIALNSSFDGLADLKLWRKKAILENSVWNKIADKLKLKDPKQNTEDAQ